LIPLRISVLDGDGLSFYVATLAQSQPDWLGTGGLTSWIERRKIAYSRDFLRLLRPSWKGKSQQNRAKRSPSDFFVHGFFSIVFALTLPSPAERARASDPQAKIFVLPFYSL